MSRKAVMMMSWISRPSCAGKRIKQVLIAFNFFAGTSSPGFFSFPMALTALFPAKKQKYLDKIKDLFLG
jgi:hypothetical protein